MTKNSQIQAEDAAAATPPATDRAPRRWPMWAALAIGLGVALAPVAFQLFDRAPKGKDMIDGFRPYMTEKKISKFQHDMKEIDVAVTEARTKLRPALRSQLQLDDAGIDTKFALYADFEKRWRGIDNDMSDMLRTMHRDLGDFAAVDALPPFNLFPWFFVAPGVLIVGAASAGLLATRRRRRGSGPRSTVAPATMLIVMGLGLIAAPVAFQMFTRAPKGGHMINDFRPLMTTPKVQRIQGYFLVIGAGEGTLRNEMLPAVGATGTASATGTANTTTAADASQFPAIARFSADWQTISNEMAPMIGAMSDNVANYQAVDALPSFPLFPWFFVAPGVLVLAFGIVARRAARTQSSQQQGDMT
ncbi:MAG: hypothetical protein WBD02_08845 [Acidimicrobiia bacterium]